MKIPTKVIYLLVLSIGTFILSPPTALGADGPSKVLPSGDSISNWVPLGKRLRASSSTFVSIVASRHVLSPSLASGPDRPYLVWAELDETGVAQVFVNFWNQESWAPLGGLLNFDRKHHAFDPVIVLVGPTPYVAWIELDKKLVGQIHLKYWSHEGWIPRGTSLNTDSNKAAANPSLAATAENLYMAWAEENENATFNIRVNMLSNGAWKPLGGILNEDSQRDGLEPSMAIVGSTPYVAWSEKGEGNVFQIFVKHWNGETWIRDGNSLNLNSSYHALSPYIASNGQTPYVTWVEFDEKGVSKIHVKHLENTTWVALGSDLNLDSQFHALNPTITLIGNTPYVAWTEFNTKGISQLHVKKWSDSHWVLEARNLNMDNSQPALTPSLITQGGRPFAAWKESDSIGLYGIYVKARTP